VGNPGSHNGQFDKPVGITVDPSGNVYVVDLENHRVQEFSSSGTFITKWGTYGEGTGQFLYPYGVAADGSGNVSVSGHTLEVKAAPGATDNLAITRPLPGTLRVSDLPSGPYSGSPVHAGGGCAQNGAQAAKCNAGMITRIDASAGDLADQVVNSTGIPGVLEGGPANDLLAGGWANDTLIGGPGANALKGRGGGDLLQARNLRSDEVIDCGDGADSASLDKLPLDPNHEVKDCETKTRH
jgi:hypothetical protein